MTADPIAVARTTLDIDFAIQLEPERAEELRIVPLLARAFREVGRR